MGCNLDSNPLLATKAEQILPCASPQNPNAVIDEAF